MGMMYLEDWQYVCKKLRDAKESIHDALNVLFNGNEMKMALEVSDRYHEIIGTIYMCSPQSEWMGGSGDQATWKNRRPHGSEQSERYLASRNVEGS